MAWFNNDYDRSYRSDPYAHPGSGGRFAEGPAYRGRTIDRSPMYGTSRGYGYDYDFRRPPAQSPTYGRQADQEVQRWARNHGYDGGFQVSPSRGGNWNTTTPRTYETRPGFNRDFDRDFDRDLSWEPQTSSREPRAGRRDWLARRSYRW